MSAEIVTGRADCYDLISSTEPASHEWLGYGGGVWYRGSTSWMTERGPATLSGDVLSVTQSVPSGESGGAWTLDIQGDLTLTPDSVPASTTYVPPDSYTCGWPKADPAAYEGDYAAVVGATLPDGVFYDVCEEPVRIHDFAGAYILVDISAMDCGPCQSAAAEEESFVASLASAGVTLHIVTLLVPSLSDTGGTPTQAELQLWTDTFELRSPVLADRLWGLSVAGQVLGDDFGYPTFVLASPDLEILMVDTGFSSFRSMERTILDHAGL